MNSNELDGTRIDKWLWAARFFKTRSLATEAVDGGRIEINGNRAKPSREVKPGDRVAVSLGRETRSVVVRGILERRGPANVAQQLYEETPESIARREEASAARRLQAEPALERQGEGRPTKRERRVLERWRGV